jgi:hypothetical protein
MNKHNNQKGSGHLLLFAAVFITLVAVLGYVGYNAWQKQSANAGGQETVGRAGDLSDRAIITCSIDIPQSVTIKPRQDHYVKVTLTLHNYGKKKTTANDIYLYDYYDSKGVRRGYESHYRSPAPAGAYEAVNAKINVRSNKKGTFIYSYHGEGRYKSNGTDYKFSCTHSVTVKVQ